MESISWSRAEPKTLLPAAVAMYEQGKSRSQVLEAIYGVALPREALLCHRAFAYEREGLAVDWRYHPWELMIPPSEGNRAPHSINDYQSDKDALAYELAPNVLLLARSTTRPMASGSAARCSATILTSFVRAARPSSAC